MQALLTGLIFLIAGAAVYAYNTESHDSKIVFNRLGLNLGETETVAVLLGLGVLFLGIGAVRWLGSLESDEAGSEDGE